MMKTAIWKNLSGKEFYESIEVLVTEAIERELKNGYELKVCVGSDSQVYGKEIQFATAVMIVRKGKGAYAFVRKEKCFQKMTIKERMLTEVANSVETAYAISGILDAYNVEMEVHADINTDVNHQSNLALKEAMGYIKGMGYSFKAKPDAYASSSCADMVV